MAASPEDPRIVDFLQEFVVDREGGSVRSLSHYLRRHPQCEAEIARLYLEMTGVEATGAAGDATRVGRFQLVRELGRGGQGVVYLARDEDLGRDVAIKMLHAGFLRGDEALLRFFREAELVARLDHPGLCPLYERGRADGRDYLVFRYVEGRTLAALLREPPADRAEVHARMRLVEDLARAVAAAHAAGVVHRDLKPSNVMVQPDGAPVVLDFGLGRAHARPEDTGEDGEDGDEGEDRGDARELATLTRSGDVFGTPDYMAPEQFVDANAGAAADVWALGCILYEALVGAPPFRATTVHATALRIQNDEPAAPRRKNRAVSRDLEVVTLAALEKDPARRTRGAAELAEDLRRIRAHEPILARRASLATRLARRARRRPAEAVALFGGLALLASIAWFRSERDVLAAARDEALSHMGQLADVELSEELVQGERDLWPVAPALVAACDDWLARLDALERAGPEHAALLARLRDRRDAEGRYADERDRVLDERLEFLAAQLERLRTVRAAVVARREQSRTIRARSIDAFADDWAACRARVAASEHYGRLDLAPQVGLVPLGANPAGLEEFWVLLTGARPPWDPERGARPALGAGIVLILVPGGPTELGAQPGDLHPQTSERPLVRATLAPYLLGKYELTQDQWYRLGGEANAVYTTGHPHFATAGETEPPLLHPAESESFEAFTTRLKHVGLELPTEAQWEHACRAGTTTAYSFGAERTDAGLYANCRAREGDAHLTDPFVGQTEYADGHVVHAPVGSYRANPWGFHDMHGNLWEWCRDYFTEYAVATARPGDGLLTQAELGKVGVVRGGTWQAPVLYARSARRNRTPRDTRESDLGVRPARAVEVELLTPATPAER